MKSYWVSYTTTDLPTEIQTEEYDFEDNIPINQQTVKEEIENHSDWYNYIRVNQIISWSKIEE